MPTMHDVARLAGVSQSTVSRVLNNSADVILNPKTIERVLEAANELGYRIDPLARALKGKSTGVIGIITRRYDSFLPQLVSELSLNFRQAGYMIIHGEANNNPDEVFNLHTLFETQFCDGLILAADPKGLDTTQTQNIFQDKHLVMTAWGVPVRGIPLVNTNNQAGIEMALTHLFELGHQRIAFLDVGWAGDHRVRRQTYQDMMEDAGLFYPPHLVTSDEGIQAGFEATQALLALNPRPTAILASEDLLAFGALRAAYHNNISVPDQLSIIGFDDLPFAEFSIPALTTIRQPIEEIAQIICDLLINLIRETATQADDDITLVKPQLIIRETTTVPCL